MKKILSLATFFVSINICTAQFPGAGRIRDKIINKTIDKATDRAADEAADKIVNSIFGQPTKKGSDSSMNAALNRLSSAVNNLAAATPPNEKYVFSSSYTMKISSKNGSQNSTVSENKYYFDKDGKFIGSSITDQNAKSSTGVSVLVFDLEKSAMYTFSENKGTKSYMGLAFNNQVVQGVTDASLSMQKIVKTSNTKTIAGYTCDGYVLESDYYKTTLWMSRGKVPVLSNYYKEFQKMSTAGQGKAYVNFEKHPEYVKLINAGSVTLGSDTVDKQGQETISEVIKISENDRFEFLTAGYQNAFANQTPKK
jgi:hypothetical protein